MADLDDLRARLENIAEELRDAAYDALRTAAEEGAAGSDEEKRLSRARRAVERAVAALGQRHDPLDGLDD